MPFHVRPAVQADSPRISEIAAATFALACPADTPLQELERYIQDSLQPEHFDALLERDVVQLRVLLTGDRIIGYSLVNQAPEPLGVVAADGVAELTRCYVAADSHGSGAAQYLLEHTLDATAGPIRLTVNDSNARAIRFYQRNGFQIVGETTFVCGADLHRDWVMLRQPGGR